MYTCIEPTLPLHMQSLWGFDSTKVGLVFLGAVIPTFFGDFCSIVQIMTRLIKFNK